MGAQLLFDQSFPTIADMPLWISEGWIVCILGTAIGAIWLLSNLMASYLQDMRDEGIDDERIRQYLATMGFSVLQQDIVIGSLRGQTAGELAREHGFSVSAIKAARNSAYKALGSSSIFQLAITLKRELSSAPGASR